MELEKYIKAAKEAINSAYFDIQDALMKNGESQEKLKNKGWKSDETAYQQEYQKIVESFKQETATAVENGKRLIQESELLELEHKRGVVRNQVSALVAQAQEMCKLDAKVKETVNTLYSELNAKKLEDSGVDITNECEFYKYQQTLSRQLSFGDFLKVELGKTMALMMR